MQVDGDDVFGLVIIKRLEDLFEQRFCSGFFMDLAGGKIGSGLLGDRGCLVRQSLTLLSTSNHLGTSQAAECALKLATGHPILKGRRTLPRNHPAIAHC